MTQTNLSAGRWTYCPNCGSKGWVDWGYELHMEIGTCPFPTGVGEDAIESAAEECDRLNDLEAVANPEPVEFDEIAEILSDEDPYSTFAYRGGNP